MSSKQPVLFIDDEKHIRIANTQTLQLAGIEVNAMERADKALPMLSYDWPGVVICDIKIPGMGGIEFLLKAQEIDRDLPVILISGHGDIAMAVQAIRDGAYDFIEKPFAADQLVETVKRALDKRALTLENRSLRQELDAQNNTPGPRIIGRSPAMQRLRSTIAQIADTDADVLLLGETGTGKELVTRSLHEHSRRREYNFVAVNCGAVPDNLIESELFGHEPGAFTGAKGRRVGRFEHANHGTLFLDEIESMPTPVQVHLLRVLQERAIERLGSNELIPLDLRVVAATKVDLKAASERAEFREDLYYRLNVVTLEIPPLRDRREDIPLLFHHFLLMAGARYRREVPQPNSDQIRVLLTHPWPGNVRELCNIADRYVLLGENVGYDLNTLMQEVDNETAITLPQQVDCFEKSLIKQQLEIQKGNLKSTMEALGIPRKTLYDKMRKYGLDKSHYKS
ncbi:MAG: sigma-54 dependent transcriptional regulator [Candidatus Thiodiazotropha taylori]|nr:sigma-54 dependent transcriptional regulator [Candidatus Thiodiazotropha taylori]MCG7962346.1 sigma-54 dependent transcriptional regulator [Candidatus Thiodiazotropha endolucinida]RLW54358.1 MAG: DNA-binding response regulator [gamma proteobacterium symbiont of Stewartia floridana]MCG7893341.1 sigma-54 dependent transcriptional regulator [Candidatus Thiodiazotropha taylori]MCG7942784.1 sigma-54 dependent transcriptional regulator [Candidatus Thiodiazotropha taylori]